jgi:hypothetical protein
MRKLPDSGNVVQKLFLRGENCSPTVGGSQQPAEVAVLRTAICRVGCTADFLRVRVALLGQSRQLSCIMLSWRRRKGETTGRHTSFTKLKKSTETRDRLRNWTRLRMVKYVSEGVCVDVQRNTISETAMADSPLLLVPKQGGTFLAPNTQITHDTGLFCFGL